MNAPVTPKGKFSTPFVSGRLGGMSGGVSAGKISGSGPGPSEKLMKSHDMPAKNLPKVPMHGKVSTKV